ncbi:hypothetical protein HPP92_008121 [Vanilla planifolia]|uniref:Uncharacterized protein n=1 Tax=Vanilla planifolia TaxID=51239 RepID=A0A835V7L8_VANPL|nr:hypothetical protein HPP92_008121 [Vanilla planifolia]
MCTQTPGKAGAVHRASRGRGGCTAHSRGHSPRAHAIKRRDACGRGNAPPPWSRWPQHFGEGALGGMVPPPPRSARVVSALASAPRCGGLLARRCYRAARAPPLPATARPR